jgi:hypothetical protein
MIGADREAEPRRSAQVKATPGAVPLRLGNPIADAIALRLGDGSKGRERLETMLPLLEVTSPPGSGR